MRSLFLLACATLFLNVDHVAATIETNSIDNISNINNINNNDNGHNHNALHYVDMDTQSRRQNWDFFGFMLMGTFFFDFDLILTQFVILPLIDLGCILTNTNSFFFGSNCDETTAIGLDQCMENKVIGPLDCQLYKGCISERGLGGTDTGKCTEFCSKKNLHGELKYSNLEVCNSDYSSSSSSSNGASAYNDNSAADGVVSGGAMVAGFEGWMAVVGASVVLALMAINMGQRREDYKPIDDGAGINLRSSVGRRMTAVSGLMDGVLGGKKGTVEMADYQLEEGGRSDSYEESAIV